MGRTVYAVVPALLLTLVHAAAAQEPTSTSGILPIEVDTVATIGADGAGPALSRLTGLAMDGEGRFYAAPTYEPGTAAVYDRDGRYLRSFGRRGPGPGEYTSRMLRVRVAPDDTVHVLDGARHTVLEPGGGAFVRLTTLPFLPKQTSFTSDGRLVAGSIQPGSEGTVYILSRAGTVERTLAFDRESGSSNLGEVGPLSNIEAGTLWAGSAERYRMELWSTDGQLLRSIERDAPWFPPQAPRPNRYGARDTRLLALLQADTLLWTLVAIPDPRADGASPIGRPLEEVDLDDYQDSVVEAIDVTSGEVVGRIRLDASVSGFLGRSPVVFTKRETDSGLVVLNVIVLSLGQRRLF